MKKYYKFFTMLSLVLLLTVSAVSAAQTYVVCQNKQQTGHGYYNACCSGQQVIMKGYYSDSSEKYFVSNYTGVQNNAYKNSAGVYSGKKNNSHYWNVKKDFKSFAHLHHFNVHLQ